MVLLISLRHRVFRAEQALRGIQFHIMTLHDMISDQYSHPYIQIISPHMREAHAALDAILHHETELPIREMMVDTAGFTELMYALYDLQGLKLSPRIRDLADQRLYPVESVSEYGVPQRWHGDGGA